MYSDSVFLLSSFKTNINKIVNFIKIDDKFIYKIWFFCCCTKIKTISSLANIYEQKAWLKTLNLIHP